MLDVIQISYFEENADEHFEILQMFAPHAKRCLLYTSPSPRDRG